LKESRSTCGLRDFYLETEERVTDRLNIKPDIEALFKYLPHNLELLLPGQRNEYGFRLKAMGEICQIGPEGVEIGRGKDSGKRAQLIMLYALNATREPCRPTPFKAFRELPDSKPLLDQFSANTEHSLIPFITRIGQFLEPIFRALDGELCCDIESEDLSIIVRPLPKIKLCYKFYLADNVLPASATCLFSNNALSFLPIDALADLGQYTSNKILELASP
jgi:hypothetical protein